MGWHARNVMVEWAIANTPSLLSVAINVRICPHCLYPIVRRVCLVIGEMWHEWIHPKLWMLQGLVCSGTMNIINKSEPDSLHHLTVTNVREDRGSQWIPSSGSGCPGPALSTTNGHYYQGMLQYNRLGLYSLDRLGCYWLQLYYSLVLMWVPSPCPPQVVTQALHQ